MSKRNFFMCITLSLLMANLVSWPNKFIFNEPIKAANKANNIQLLAEETGWYYRTVNGKLQKRLWSYTYRRWLTSWVWV